MTLFFRSSDIHKHEGDIHQHNAIEYPVYVEGHTLWKESKHRWRWLCLRSLAICWPEMTESVSLFKVIFALNFQNAIAVVVAPTVLSQTEAQVTAPLCLLFGWLLAVSPTSQDYSNVPLDKNTKCSRREIAFQRCRSSSFLLGFTNPAFSLNRHWLTNFFEWCFTLAKPAKWYFNPYFFEIFNSP